MEIITTPTVLASDRQRDFLVTSPTSLSSPDEPVPYTHPTTTSTSTTPLTPQRGRLSTRYPDSLARVPLHRRGTSKTYERLEDLLREAGYKETRVFTPETDPNSHSTVERDDGTANGVRGGVGAVVGFIAGLVSRGSSLSHGAAPLKDDPAQSTSHPWSSPPSPLAHAIHMKDNKAKRVPSRTSLSRKSSVEGIRRHTDGDLPVDLPHAASQALQYHSSRGLPHNPRSYPRAHHHHLNFGHPHQLNHYSSKSASKSNSHNPPNARAYLRHMVSAPNIQPLTKRPSLSEASLRSHALRREHRRGGRPTFILNDEASTAEFDYEQHPRITLGDNEHQVHPPLPRNWIENVARALLSGASGPVVASDAASTRTARTTSTQISSALSDKSNQEDRGRAPMRRTKTPLLCVQVQDMKARTSQSQVACTRVMCRSTPTSRAGSRVRSSAHEEHANRRRRIAGEPSKNRRSGRDRDADVVPSLARTKVENDDWMAPHQRYAKGWGMQGSARACPDGTWSDDSDHDDDDDDEEGELGLDRLLVPARRQHSIQSLRRHLQPRSSQAHGGRGAPGTRSPRSGRASPSKRAPTRRQDWGDGSWNTGHTQDWISSRGEDDEDGYNQAAGSGRLSSKWRPGLPSFTQWTTSSNS